MEHEELDRLLAEYATGGLSEEDKKTLFAAALKDQDLFEQLMEEDALREAIELPGARNRLIDSLQEDLVMAEKAMAGSAAAPSVLRMPAPAAPQQPKREPEQSKSNWLAWAAGIGIVFVSGAITYVVGPLLGPAPTMKEVSQVFNSTPKDTKPFVPPPAPAATPRKVIVEEPPKIVAEARKPMPRPISIPLPSAPPPAEPITAEKEAKASEVIRAARAERDRSSAQAELRLDQQRVVPLPAPYAQQQAPAGAPATVARRQAPGNDKDNLSAGALGGMAKTADVREAKAKSNMVVPPAIWRNSGDGVWIRVPDGDTASPTDSLSVRYTPRSFGPIALVDANGRRLAVKAGRIGEGLEFPIPAALLQGATGDSVTISITEGNRSTFLKILLRNR